MPREAARDGRYDSVMTLADLAAKGLPLNRKERFYTGTVFPAIVCAEDFKYFERLGELIDGCPPLVVDADPSSTNVQVFTEYGLLESIFADAAKKRFPTPPEARDTPDILIFVASTPPVLIALEAKMYDRPTCQALQEQMRRQRTIVLDYLRPVLGVAPDHLFHSCLLPQKLLDVSGYQQLGYPVITWEALLAKFGQGRPDDYWRAVLRLALDSYDVLASRAALYGQNAEATLTGATIYDAAKADAVGYTLMGRNFGLHGDPLREDVESGRWRKQNYEVSSAAEPPNKNWFNISEFVALVDALDTTA